jgi:hypothetical protein
MKNNKTKGIDFWTDCELPITFITKKKALDIMKEEIDYNGEIPSKVVFVKHKKKDVMIYVDNVGDLCVQLGTDIRIARALERVEN